MTGGLSALPGAAEIAAMRQVVKRILDEAVDRIVDEVIAKVTEPVNAKLEAMVEDMVLDLAEGAFSMPAADGSGGGGHGGKGGMHLASAGVTGPGLHAANSRLQELGIPISVRPRHVYRNGDLALLIVDWAIDGTDQRGQAVHVNGTATDVARRGSDARWRYVIDNPFSTRSQQLLTKDTVEPTF